jgi:hypothetical protein
MHAVSGDVSLGRIGASELSRQWRQTVTAVARSMRFDSSGLALEGWYAAKINRAMSLSPPVQPAIVKVTPWTRALTSAGTMVTGRSSPEDEQFPISSKRTIHAKTYNVFTWTLNDQV